MCRVAALTSCASLCGIGLQAPRCQDLNLELPDARNLLVRDPAAHGGLGNAERFR